MTDGTRSPSRRTLLKGGAAIALAATVPAPLRAQGATLRLGVLTPLTGAGGFDGPRMLKAMQAVAAEVNAAGGLLGRKIELVVEDDQTNPEAAVRAARKLVDVDKVPVIMGTWASAVTTAVAPVCWESKTFLTTVSGADTITQLPHQGYLIRTQPNSRLQATKLVRPDLCRYITLALPKQGKLSPACRVVAERLQQLVQSWGHQLTEPPATVPNTNASPATEAAATAAAMPRKASLKARKSV